MKVNIERKTGLIGSAAMRSRNPIHGPIEASVRLAGAEASKTNIVSAVWPLIS
jgi:hypothetical protein